MTAPEDTTMDPPATTTEPLVRLDPIHGRHKARSGGILRRGAVRALTDASWRYGVARSSARVVEEGRAAQVSGDSRHSYTEALLSATPSLLERSERIVLHGPVPSATDPPSGCPFRTRCWKADGACATVFPAASDGADGHRRHCVRPQEGAVPAAV